MRRIHWVRSPIKVWRNLARERYWRTRPDGIHAAGKRPSASSSRSQRASSRSVFARRLRPRNARVTAGGRRIDPARISSPESVSRASKLISARCTSDPGHDRHQRFL
jgi:hypothetical protein